MHLRGAALLLASRLSAPNPLVVTLLQDWMSATVGWMSPNRRSPAPEDVSRLLVTLHILHTQALSLPDSQTSDTSPAFVPGSLDPPPLEMVRRGIGPAGFVQIPPDIWLSSAPGGLLLADALTPPQKPSNCPLVQAMLDALLAAGLVAIHPGLPNAEVFVKRKSSTKAALIINMRTLNSNCPIPPREIPPSHSC